MNDLSRILWFVDVEVDPPQHPTRKFARIITSKVTDGFNEWTAVIRFEWSNN